MNRKEMKRSAKGVVKRHWLVLVCLCLAAALLGTEFNHSVMLIQMGSGEETAAEEGVRTDFGGSGDLYEILQESYQKREPRPEERSDGFLGSVFGHSRGVLASVMNVVTSGKAITTVLMGIRSMTGSDDLAVAVFIGLSMILTLAFWLFVKQVYTVALRRVVLEGEEYEKVSLTRLTFPWREGRWKRIAGAMLRCTIYQFLWWCTIVGGIIKQYSYYMVPYILAENPTLTGREAITLSRRMMKGHKWQCFVCELSFLGWALLSIVTFGLSQLLFSAPYEAAFFGRYYAYVRADAKARNVPDVEKLADNYLFEKASPETLDGAYPLSAQCADRPEDFISRDKGLRHFLAVNFGVSLYSRAQEVEYDQAVAAWSAGQAGKDMAAGLAYPVKLCPAPTKEHKEKIPQVKYLRHYSVYSLILMFIMFAFVGWLWEVAIGLVQGGVFVNRGVLHGPWLPIYGTGATMILVVLARFRQKPMAEFFLAIALSGAVEYFTSWYLEMAHGGMRWWDYTGYFLNLNGRICAEGLLVFGVAGVAVVYYLAPAIDDVIRKIKPAVAITLAAALLAVFIVDNAYSSVRPNAGPGVTDVTAAYMQMQEGTPWETRHKEATTRREAVAFWRVFLYNNLTDNSELGEIKWVDQSQLCLCLCPLTEK